MPKPLDPRKREAIANAIRAGAGTRSAGNIAKEHGVARSTVLRIADQDGIEGAWDRTKTDHASRAKKIDNRARRAALVEAYLADAEKIRERLWEPAETVTAMGEVVYLSKPGARDVRDFVVAGTSLIKTSIDVEKHDTDDDSGAAAVDSWLRHLLGRD